MSMAWQHLGPQADQGLGHDRPEVGNLWPKVHASIRMQNYSSALRALTSHISAHPTDYIAYDLRCVCALHCSDYQQALADALQCTALNPTWGRGWARLGAAQLCAGHPTASVSAYAKGLQMDPKNEEMTVGMELAKREIERRDQNNRRAATHDS